MIKFLKSVMQNDEQNSEQKQSSGFKVTTRTYRATMPRRSSFSECINSSAKINSSEDNDEQLVNSHGEQTFQQHRQLIVTPAKSIWITIYDKFQKKSSSIQHLFLLISIIALCWTLLVSRANSVEKVDDEFPLFERM
jgi:hypothetical protein